jgi:Pao retrotransposon peptidase
MSIFDPLGFVTPIILKAKQIYSQIAKEAHGNWDTRISTTLMREWKEWRKSIQTEKPIEIKRWIRATRYHYKGFSHPSKDAIGYAIYIYEDDKKEVNLV